MSILLFTSHLKKSDQHLVGSLLGSMNFKSSKEYNLDTTVLEGLKIYRSMSNFITDHPLFKESISHLLRRVKDSDIATRILMDHFFAKKWEQEDHEGYHSYIADFYQKLVQNKDITPVTIRRLLPEIIGNCIFSNLHTIGGYHRYVNFLVNENKISSMVTANLVDFQEHYLLLSRNFEIIYNDFKNEKWDDLELHEEFLEKAC
jgi:acyl carrier protein phosphodiesterase